MNFLPYNYIRIETHFNNKYVSPSIHIILIAFLITFPVSILRKDTYSIIFSIILFILYIISVYELGKYNITVEGFKWVRKK